MMKQIEVHIMGQSYLLVCTPEGEKTLRQAVARVDTSMCQIRDAGKLKARERIAVLSALNIAADAIEACAQKRCAQTHTLFAETHSDVLSPEQQILLDRLDQALADENS